MRTAALSMILAALLAAGCASTPSAPAPASMSIMPQGCTPDLYTDPYACGQSGAGYYDSGPYTDHPILLTPYYPGGFPVPAPPVKKPPAPPTPPAKPPAKPMRPKPQPCPKSDKPCP